MERKRKLSFIFVLFPIFVLILALTAFSSETEAAYTVKYGEIQNSKFVNAYPNRNQTGKAGQVIQTRKVADKNGKRCYWKISGNGGATGEIINGGTFTLKGNANLSTVWKPLYTIRFFKYNGTAEHKDKKITLAKGETFYLPNITPHETKIFKGWARTKNATAANYTVNKKYTMVGNLDLYEVVVMKPKVTVQFWSQSGGGEYQGQRKTVYQGQKITLPSESSSLAYSFLGWSTKLSQLTPEYKTGSTYQVNGNIKLYAVYVKNPDVAQLKTLNGNNYKTVKADGKTVTFPSVAFNNCTLQGWSTQKGKTCNPEYLEGDIIPKKAATYYMVVATTPANSQLGSTGVIKESSKYAYTYFVGDSRMAHAGARVKTLKKTRIIAISGTRYDWLSQQGGAYDRMVAKVKADNKITSKKKAVIFCHGVNDLVHINQYIAFYKAKASELKKLGCDIYVMSINPFCTAQRPYWYKTVQGKAYTEGRTQAQRAAFNKALSTQLSGIYTYVDTFSYLRRTGWPTADLTDHPKADGLHYTLDTTKRIITEAIRIMDAHY